jgi:hypothetical protein
VPSREKPARRPRSLVGSPFSAVRFEDEILRNRHVSRISEYEAAEFLCTSDCVAERVRFEPPVRFCDAKPRHIRKLQIAKPYQRTLPYNPTSEFCNQSGFDSPSIRPERRMLGDSLDKIGHFAKPQAA